MRKYILVLVAVSCTLKFYSCGKATPETYLDKAVIRSATVAGFAGNTLSLELKNPPIKFNSDGAKIVMSRQQIIYEKIKFSKNVLHELTRMNSTPDVVDILTTSIDLHKFLVEVYQTDYTELARMYDREAPVDSIAAFDNTLRNRHASMFALHYENLVRGGKLYAARHKLKLNGLQERML